MNYRIRVISENLLSAQKIEEFGEWLDRKLRLAAWVIILVAVLWFGPSCVYLAVYSAP